MNRVRVFGARVWKQKWWILAAIIAVFVMLREWSPVSYRYVGGGAAVMSYTLHRGEPLAINTERCNDTPETAEIRYARRLESRDGHTWPFGSGISFIEPGCTVSWAVVGVIPEELPLGQWRFRTSVTSTNWLGRQVFVTWYSDWFEVVA